MGMKRISRLLIALALAIFLSPTAKVYAADNKEVSGKVRYDYAFKVLELVNKERSLAGIPNVEMDASLLESAMARSAEITVTFNHVRPNGENCFTINDKVFGENIAWGQKTPSAVMNSWMSSQGHKSNILNKSYKSIGIGCFESGNNIYWVQQFGYAKAENVTEPESGSVKYQVALTKSGETKLLQKVDTGNSLETSENTIVEKKTTKETSAEKTTSNNTSAENSTDKRLADDGKTSFDNSHDNKKATKVKGFKAVSGKKKITLKWKEANVEGYQLQISDKKNYKKSNSYYVSSSGTKLVLKKYKNKKLKSKKKYYVRIRTFIYSDNVMKFGKWKKTSVKTK